MYVYYYCHVIIIFCYKVNDSRTKNSKISNCLSILSVICRYLMYYLCIDEYGCVGQFNIVTMGWVLSFN